MKILLLTPQLPYPAVSGGLIKTEQIIEYLNDNHQLEIACFLKGEDQNHLREYQAEIAPVKVHSQAIDIPRTGINFLRSCLAGIPLTIFRNRLPAFASLVERLAEDKDVLFLDHYLMFQYVPKQFKGRVVVHQHNAEFLMWSRKAELESSWLMKQLLSFEAERIKQYELQMCRKVDAVLVTCSDQQALEKAGADTRRFFETLHCGDEHNLTAPAMVFEQTELKLLFIGTLTWEANLDGLLWFGKEVWPKLKEIYPELGLTVVGKCPAGLKQTLIDALPGADIAGFVDDLDAVYASHRVFIAPLRFGSGVKIKVINSLLRGIPTVATEVGAEGINIKEGEQMFVRDEPQAFLDAIVTLLRNEQAWQRLSTESRQWMKDNYTYTKECENLKRSLGL